MAARQLAAVAQPLQGPVASARPCAPLRMRSITTGVSHLYRADPSSGHRAPMLLRDAGGCDDGSATRCTCSRALCRPSLIRRPRSALHIRKAVNSTVHTPRLARISEPVHSVRASATSSRLCEPLVGIEPRNKNSARKNKTSAEISKVPCAMLYALPRLGLRR